MWTLMLWVLLLLCNFSLAAPPAKPENISCILYHNRNLTCTWSPEKEISATKYIVTMTYSFGKRRRICNATSASCSFFPPYVLPPDICSIEVEAQNEDGKNKSDTTYWDLYSIMKTEPPEILSVKRILGMAQMVQIRWRTHEVFDPIPYLRYTLRFRTVNSTHWMEVGFGSYDHIYNLTGLQAFMEYAVVLRYRTNESSIWSNWSKEKMGMTEEEAPYGLELWRVLRPADTEGKRKVLLLWKKARGAPILEKTLGYNISYFPENNTNLTEVINSTNQHCELLLTGETHWVFVTSYNSLGTSPKAILRIPAVQENTFRCIEGMQARLAEDLLLVEWQSSAPKVNTWVVEWLLDSESEFPSLSWEPVSQAMNWTIKQDKLKPFSCYNISVYPILGDQVGEPYSIQAYAKEKAPSEGPKVTKVKNIGVKTVTVTWKEIPKSSRNGFINNYTIFYQAEGGKEFSKTVNSSILQCDLESLTRKTSYTVWVMASTRAGGFNGTVINFKTLSISVAEIIFITSLVGGGLLLLIIFTVTSALKKPDRLTHLCCPDVPNPAESSLATWRGDDIKDKSNKEEVDDSGNTDDRILKVCSVPADLIDKLVVNFENFLEVISTEEVAKGQENILGGEANEYVTSPSRPPCSPGKSLEEPLVITEITSRDSNNQCLEMVEEIYSQANEQLLSSGQSLGLDYLSEGVPNPYLKNSVTTREFLVHDNAHQETKPSAIMM
ncbi:interleukin-31 receptor subunit alpha [Nannospalax galili]|uniref:interleukin-31 receptor subunit alpha n=1 Tax=Nannospalax galili TaxID=1026970 RepID=UPI00111BD471|nr:interleukin-31 receptor subunit alpha [Nannospalax galili]